MVVMSVLTCTLFFCLAQVLHGCNVCVNMYLIVFSRFYMVVNVCVNMYLILLSCPAFTWLWMSVLTCTLFFCLAQVLHGCNVCVNMYLIVFSSFYMVVNVCVEHVPHCFAIFLLPGLRWLRTSVFIGISDRIWSVHSTSSSQKKCWGRRHATKKSTMMHMWVLVKAGTVN